MIVEAHAKINLTLNVVGKREDGYHELEMIMLPLALHDTIEISIAKEDMFTTDDSQVAMDDTNTVVRAVQLMRNTFALKEHFHVHLHKRIPSQAGLAGGSADGAAVLRGIQSLCHLSITMEELAQLGKQLGADVPFCVLQESALVQGIGEKLTPFHFDWKPHVLLVKPSIGVSNKEAFATLDFAKCPHPNAHIIQKLLQNKEYEQLPQYIANSLEYSAFQLVPQIADIKQELIAMGFPCVLMSGSGSTVFALSEDKTRIEKALRHYAHTDMFVCDTTFYP